MPCEYVSAPRVVFGVNPSPRNRSDCRVDQVAQPHRWPASRVVGVRMLLGSIDDRLERIRIELEKLAQRVVRRQADRTRVRADVGATEYSRRPVRQVVAFEAFEERSEEHTS